MQALRGHFAQRLFIASALCFAARLEPLRAGETTTSAHAERPIRLCGDHFLRVATHFERSVQRTTAAAALNAELESLGYFTTPRAIARREKHSPPRLTPADARALAERFFSTSPHVQSVHRRLFLAAFSFEFARGLNRLARDNNGKVTALHHGESVRVLLANAVDAAFAIAQQLVPEGKRASITASDVDWLATPLLHAGIPASTIRTVLRFVARDKPRHALERLLGEHARLQRAIPRFDDGSGLHSVRGAANFAQLKSAYRAHLLEKGMRPAEADHFLAFVEEEVAAGRRRPWHELAAAYLRDPLHAIVRETRETIVLRAGPQREPLSNEPAVDPADKECDTAREAHHYLRQLTDESLLLSDSVMATKLALRGGADLVKTLQEKPWILRQPVGLDFSHPTLRAFQRDVQVDDVRELLRNFLATRQPVPGVISWKHRPSDESRNDGVIIEGRVSTGKVVRVVLAPSWESFAMWRIITVMRPTEEARTGWRHNAETDEERAHRELDQLTTLARDHLRSPPELSAEAREDLERLRIDVATALAPVAEDSVFLMPDRTPYWFFQRSPTSVQLHRGRYIYGFFDRPTGLHVQVSLVAGGEGGFTLRIDRLLSERLP